MITSSVAEVLSLASVLPFLAVLANPDELWNQAIIQQWSPVFGISNASGLLLPLTLIFALLSLLAGGIRLLNLWLNCRLAAAIGSDLSCDSFRRTLFQPYLVHVNRNSSQLIASISTDVNRVIYNIINPLLLLLSSALIALSLIITLVLVDWILALGTGIVISLVYLVAVAISQEPLRFMGRQQLFFNQRLIQVLQEGLGAIRDVLLSGHQRFYLVTYNNADRRLRRAGQMLLFSVPIRVLFSSRWAWPLLPALVIWWCTSRGSVELYPFFGALGACCSTFVTYGAKDI